MNRLATLGETASSPHRGGEGEDCGVAPGLLARVHITSIPFSLHAASSATKEKDSSSTRKVGKPSIAGAPTSQSTPPGARHAFHFVPAPQSQVRPEIVIRFTGFSDRKGRDDFHIVRRIKCRRLGNEALTWQPDRGVSDMSLVTSSPTSFPIEHQSR